MSNTSTQEHDGSVKSPTTPAAGFHDNAFESLSAERSKYFGLRKLDTGKPNLDVSILLLDLKSSLSIKCDRLVFDFDETIARDTGENLHDGPSARYARTALELLKKYKDSFTEGSFKEEHLSTWTNEVQEDWHSGARAAWEKLWVSKFKVLTGRPDSEVKASMVLEINQIFGLNVGLKEYDETMRSVMPGVTQLIKDTVSLVPHVSNPISKASEAGVSLSLCTSSPKDVVEGLFYQLRDDHGLVSKHFSNAKFVYDAQKKVKKDCFSGNGVREAVEPNESVVMFGDSEADVMGMLLHSPKAGAVVIRLQGDGHDCEEQYLRFCDRLEQVMSNHSIHETSEVLQRFKIFVVRDFRQVELVEKMAHSVAPDGSRQPEVTVIKPDQPFPEYVH